MIYHTHYTNGLNKFIREITSAREIEMARAKEYIPPIPVGLLNHGIYPDKKILNSLTANPALDVIPGMGIMTEVEPSGVIELELIGHLSKKERVSLEKLVFSHRETWVLSLLECLCDKGYPIRSVEMLENRCNLPLWAIPITNIIQEIALVNDFENVNYEAFFKAHLSEFVKKNPQPFPKISEVLQLLNRNTRKAAVLHDNTDEQDMFIFENISTLIGNGIKELWVSGTGTRGWLVDKLKEKHSDQLTFTSVQPVHV